MKKIFASLLVSTLCISSASAVNPQRLTQVKGSREEATVVNSEDELSSKTVAAKQQQQQKQQPKRRTWLAKGLLLTAPIIAYFIGILYYEGCILKGANVISIKNK